MSEVTAVRADAVEGKEDAKERIRARRAPGERSVGGVVGEGPWKREGCALSVLLNASEFWDRGVGRRKARTDLEKLPVGCNMSD